MGEKSGWAPWRLLFLVEGFPSCLVAVAVWKGLPDGISDAKFLTRREKDVATARLKSEDAEGDENADGHKKLKVREILQALRDPKCYLTAVSNALSFGLAVTLTWRAGDVLQLQRSVLLHACIPPHYNQ